VSAVAGQRARQQARLAEHLEAVADAEHRQAPAGALDDVLHQRRAGGDGAGAQVVAVGETAGEDDRVDVLQVVVGVPERDRLAAGQSHGPRRIDVVQRSREGDDPDAHGSSVLGQVQFDVLDDGVGQQGLGDLRQLGLVGRALDVEDEVLALPHAAHAAVAEPAERAEDRLPLGVADLRLEDDVDDHPRHAPEATGRPVAPTAPCRDPAFSAHQPP
jgi:hypothetical protein